MNKKIKLAIIFLILVLLVPITVVFAATKEGIWNGVNLRDNTLKWSENGTFASTIERDGKTYWSIESIYNNMNDARNKSNVDRFSWINSEPQNVGVKGGWVFEDNENGGEIIWKQGVACVGHVNDGNGNLVQRIVNVYDIYPNTTTENGDLQILAKLISESVGKR